MPFAPVPDQTWEQSKGRSPTTEMAKKKQQEVEDDRLMQRPQGHLDLVEDHGVAINDDGRCMFNAHGDHVPRRAATEAPLAKVVYHIVEAEEMDDAIEFAEPSTRVFNLVRSL